MGNVPAALVIGYGLGALLLGVLAGALVNTLADRVVGVDEPIWSARQCRKCLQALPTPSPFAPPELFKRRKCESCGRPTSRRRPLVQLALALLLPLALWRAYTPVATLDSPTSAAPGWAIFGLAAIALTALAFIFVVDLEHRLIFDLSLFPPLIAIIAVVALSDRTHLATVLVPAVVCGAIFLLFYGLGWLLYRQEALGFGDVKLALLIGAVVGWQGLTATLMVTVVVAAIISVLLLASGAANRRTFIPFGVFMALAAALVPLFMGFPW